jgi:DNA-binding phage protein
MSNKLTRSHKEATIERFKRDPELASEFLAAISKDGDQAELQHAQHLVASALERLYEKIAPKAIR